ncbi:MAG: DUF6531 domain-containing protein, partial [Vicinamibacteria bacterium]
MVLRTDGPSFEFARTYNSQEGREGALGFGWIHSYEVRVEPTRDEGEFVYLPDGMADLGFLGSSTYGGALSDTVTAGTQGAAQTSGSDLYWSGLPSAVFDDIESMTLEVVWNGTFRVEALSGGQPIASAVLDSHGARKVERLELKNPDGSLYRSPGPITVRFGRCTDCSYWYSFDSSDRLFYARLHVRYRGREVQRIRAQWAGSSNWPSTTALTDEDPTTCVEPGGGVERNGWVQFSVNSSIANAFAVEVLAAVHQGWGGDPAVKIWLGDDSNELQEEFRVGGVSSGRYRFTRMRNGALPLLDRARFYSQVPSISLCKIEYNILAAPEQVDVVTEEGGHERFTRNATGIWEGAPGVRSKLADLEGGGYTLTRPDGTTLYLDELGADGAYLLGRIEDPQGRGLNLTYAGERLAEVAEDDVPSRKLSFGYD